MKKGERLELTGNARKNGFFTSTPDHNYDLLMSVSAATTEATTTTTKATTEYNNSNMLLKLNSR